AISLPSPPPRCCRRRRRSSGSCWTPTSLTRPSTRSAMSSTTGPNGRRFLSKGSWNSSRPSAARRLQEDGERSEVAQQRSALLGRLSLDLQKRVVAHRNDVSEHLREPCYSPGSSWALTVRFVSKWASRIR